MSALTRPPALTCTAQSALLKSLAGSLMYVALPLVYDRSASVHTAGMTFVWLAMYVQDYMVQDEGHDSCGGAITCRDQLPSRSRTAETGSRLATTISRCCEGFS